jgi:hypothetical protein
VKFLVDSGAVYSVAPAAVLRRLGIKPHSTRRFILADGREISRRIGDAVFVIDGNRGASPVIFGERGDSCSAPCHSNRSDSSSIRSNAYSGRCPWCWAPFSRLD